MLTSEVAVVKSHHGISVNWSQYQDTGPTDPSLIENGYKINQLDRFWCFSVQSVHQNDILEI